MHMGNKPKLETELQANCMKVKYQASGPRRQGNNSEKHLSS